MVRCIEKQEDKEIGETDRKPQFEVMFFKMFNN